jgi:hypothetical protein
MTLVNAAEGRASLAVAKHPGTERIVVAGELEDIVAESAGVETRLATEHTAAVVAETAEMSQRLGHIVAVAVAVPSGYEESSLWKLEGVVSDHFRCRLTKFGLMISMFVQV